MTARRVRESPRLVTAALLAGALLVAVGILVATATAGTTTRTRTVIARPSAQLTTAVRADGAQISSLRHALGNETSRAGALSAQVRALQVTSRCWHAKAQHPRKTRSLHCTPAG